MIMSANASPDAYAAVLADLRAQRAKIDNAIEALEALIGVSPAESAESAQISDGAYTGMVIHDAAIALLRERGKPLGNAEIAKSLKAGGLKLNSADPVNTVGAVLSRRAQAASDIVKVGRGIWGLPEWEKPSPLRMSMDAFAAASAASHDKLKSWDHIDLE